MKRFVLAAALFAAILTSQSFGQARAGRVWQDGARRSNAQRIDAPRRGLASDQSGRPRQLYRQQLRDPANCPQDVRPGCGDPRDNRQHQWCDRPAGSRNLGWYDRSGGNGRRGRGSFIPGQGRGGRFWNRSR